MTEQTQAHSEEMTRADIEMRFLGKALQDEAFKQDLLANPGQIWQQELGDTFLKDWQLKVLEDTADTLYLIVPHQDEQLRQELQQHPGVVWRREFGTDRLEGYVVRVVEEAPHQFCLVLPWHDPRFPQSVVIPETLPSRSMSATERQAGDSQQRAFNQRFQYRRPMPKSKMGRLLCHIENWFVLQVRANPIVVTIMQPFQQARSWIAIWNRI